MKSKDGKCPACGKNDSRMKGTSGMDIFSECRLCGQIFWQNSMEIFGEPTPLMLQKPTETIKSQHNE